MNPKTIDIFGTLGPSCEDPEILKEMFSEGMSGIRINLSHVMLSDYADRITMVKDSAESVGISPKILIDMQGPEIRIGSFEKDLQLEEGKTFILGSGGIPVDSNILAHLNTGSEVLLDDGKILARVTETKKDSAILITERGGVLAPRKSLAVRNVNIKMPTMTETDLINLRCAPKLGITGVMQPFVRNRNDLINVRQALSDVGGQNIRLYAKIENQSGIGQTEDLIAFCDEIVIARGDLGNALPLWELPRAQKKISAICNNSRRPFMVVTQMLSSMENSPVPTRAEVSDIYNAVLDGASSVMVTGETAIGKYPVEVIRYLSKTANEALKDRQGS